MEGGGQSHDPAALTPVPFTPVNSFDTHCTGGWVGPGPVWTGVEKRKSLAWYGRDRVSSCNTYAVQQDTQSLIKKFIVCLHYVLIK